MIGHDLSKPGDWYEEHYVVSQLLRLLLGEVESVRWEARGEDGVGVDCAIVEDGSRIAVQCKTRSTRSWTIADLIRERPASGRSLLRDAKHQLEQHPGSRFRFVSDAPCPELKRVLEGVQTTSPEDPTWHTADSAQRILEHWALRDGPDLLELAHDLLGRLELQVVDARSLDGFNQTLANALAAPGEASAFMTSLLRHARTEQAADLRIDAVEATLRRDGVTLQPRPGGPEIHRRLDQLAKSYVASITNARTLRRIDRAQTAQVLEALQQTEPEHAGQVILVHGPAGAGKSEVLCAVVEQLNAQDQPLLVLLPDQDEQELGLGGDPVATLRRHAGHRGAALVIDQLDQALMTGSSGAMVRRCQSWVLSARSLGISVVVGCRTVDAEKDTQLKTLLLGPDAQQPISIAVGDLEEPDVIQSLENRVALIDLDPPVRRLARRPLMLRLLVELIDNGVVVSGLTSAVEIVDRWWEIISTHLSVINSKRATDAMDQLLELIERDARLAIERSRLSDKQAIEALKRAGVLLELEEERRGRTVIRPAHQYLSDVLIVRRWRELAAPDALLERLGPREDQSLHEARRLRLLAPLLADDRSGQAKLDAVMRSSDVRTLVKRGLLLGLASVEEPSPRLVSIVKSWLEQPTLKNLTMDSLLRAQVQWIEAISLAGWIDQEWRDSDDAGQHRILQLLASVAVSWGDGVSEHLARWVGDDPKVLERAGNVFLHSPGDDSDALFEMRLASLKRGFLYGSPNWKRLLREHPGRGARLLAAVLEKTDPQDLWRWDLEWAFGFPNADEMRGANLDTCGLVLWEELRSWWLSERAPSSGVARAQRPGVAIGFIESLVELMALNLGSAMARDQSVWTQLNSELPEPLRDLDGWLLLRLGASLEADGSDLYDALVDWLCSEPWWAALQMPRDLGGRALHLARDLLVNLGRHASDAALSKLEHAVCCIRDRWTPEEERSRFEAGIRYGAWAPTRIGATARTLLAALPASRLSRRTRARLVELERKLPDAVASPAQPYWGYVQSKIPDAEADRFTVDRWCELLSDPRLSDGSPWPSLASVDGQQQLCDVSLFTLVDQLGRLAAQSPRRYLVVADSFDFQIPAAARRVILDALVSGSSRDQPDQSVDALEVDGLMRLVTKPCFLREPECALSIASFVLSSPSLCWPETVIKRIYEVARQPVEPCLFDELDPEGLGCLRQSQPACLAARAIGMLAERDETLQEDALVLAEELGGSVEPSQRAEAALLAYRCRSAFPDTALRLVIDACRRQVPSSPVPEVVAEPDVADALLTIASQARYDKALRDAARDLLLALVGDERDRVARLGGYAVMELRFREVIDDQCLGDALAVSTAARLGAVDVLPRSVTIAMQHRWLERIALRLADDPDDTVSKAAAVKLTHAWLDGSEAGSEVLNAMLRTRGGLASLGIVVQACDRFASLLPVGRRVVEMARNAVANRRSDDAPGEGEWVTHEICGRLARLVEEADRKGAYEMRAAALDAWDVLIEASLRSAADALDGQLAEGA